MTISSGFYNSINHDRLYSNYDFSNLFEGIITSGVYENVGTAFTVRPAGGNSVNVGPGAAWLNGYWLRNDSQYTISLDGGSSDSTQYIVLEINFSERKGSIKAVDSYTSNGALRQYPIARITIPGGSSSINSSNITRMVGKGQSTPYVTLVLGGSEAIPISEVQGIF